MKKISVSMFALAVIFALSSAFTSQKSFDLDPGWFSIDQSVAVGQLDVADIDESFGSSGLLTTAVDPGQIAAVPAEGGNCEDAETVCIARFKRDDSGVPYDAPLSNRLGIYTAQ